MPQLDELLLCLKYQSCFHRPIQIMKLRKPQTLWFDSERLIVHWPTGCTQSSLLSRERVNKRTKKMNSLLVSPVVISYATLQKNSYLQVLLINVGLNLYMYLGLSALCQKYFGFTYKNCFYNSFLGVWISRWNTVSCVWYVTSLSDSDERWLETSAKTSHTLN